VRLADGGGGFWQTGDGDGWGKGAMTRRWCGEPICGGRGVIGCSPVDVHDDGTGVKGDAGGDWSGSHWHQG
jgi:hypothetical protein